MAAGKGKKSASAARKARWTGYKNNHTREKNKLVKVAVSEGYDRAIEYAEKNGISTFAKKRLATFRFRNVSLQSNMRDAWGRLTDGKKYE